MVCKEIKMKKFNLYDPIDINASMPDSRSLIMPHQSEAVDAMTEYFELEKDISDRKGIVVMPTGSGKTYTAVTWLLKQGVANGYRVVWLVHRQELVEQTFMEFRKQAPLLKNTGVKKLRVLPISGEHMHMSTASRADVYVCSIASVANKYGYRFIERMLGVAGKRKVIVVIDEAHHSVAANYQKVLKRIQQLNPNMVLLGLTATPVRMNDSEQQRLQSMYHINRNLSQRKGVHGYVYEVTLKQLLMSGFLAKPYYEKIDTEIVGEIEYQCTPDDEEYFLKFGELSEQIKKQIAKSSARNMMIVKRYLEHKERYGKTIVFAVNQLHAETLCDEFKKVGVSCDYAVSGRSDSQEVIRNFKDNKFDVLINVQILTEGSDVPDIQTVFLTRQTNSDSLLMQMIGRGLRGEKAGGTKDAYIVAFHDTWNTFAHWMDPGQLEIFEDVVEVEEHEEEVLPEIEPKVEEAEESQVIAIDEDTEGLLNIKELYMKIYGSVRASLVAQDGFFTFPAGWYSIVNDEGDAIRLLVYDSQIESFKDISRNVSNIRNKMDAEVLLDVYFSEIDVKPDEMELTYFLDYIDEVGSMPPYFTFEEREKYDPTDIANKMESMFSKDEEKEEWLKTLYDESMILQQIYKFFYAFKKTVYDALKQRKEADIVTEDERQEYQIVENYYDLQELLHEVLDMYPKLNAEGLVRIAWSKNVVKQWYALCQKFEAQEVLYQITVNRLLSSPKVDREVIKYLIFHELLHENGYWDHDDEFRIREWQYPNAAELDGFLDSLSLEYNLEIHLKDAVGFEKPELVAGDLHEKEQIQETAEPTFDKKAPGVQEGFKYCRNCGNKLPQSAKFCDKCGSAVEY